MSYLERYLNGEHEQVWNELIALGDKVREEPIYSDARAVARETMQRTRRNIETVYQRLKNLGYEFEIEKPRNLQNPLDMLKDQLADNPLMKSMFGNMMGGMQDALNNLLGGQAANTPPKEYRAYMPPEDDIVQRLDEFEKEIGVLPMSVRAWCEIVGSVDFIGDYPGLASYHREAGNMFDIGGMVRQTISQNPQMASELENTDDEAFEAYLDEYPDNFPFPKSMMMDMHKLIKQEMKSAQEAGDTETDSSPKETWWVSDPLSFGMEIDAEEARWEMDDYDDDDDFAGQYALTVAPDELHKANISGSTYDIVVPNAGIDAPLDGTDFHFVAYLRNSFAWGGFPGLVNHDERDEKLIASLKEGLEPI